MMHEKTGPRWIEKTPLYEIRCSTNNLPVKDRKITDVCCLVAFITLGLIFGANLVHGAIKGGANQLIAPYDPDGSRCGIG